MDTVLGFPELFASYTKKSLPQLTNIRDIYKRWLFKIAYLYSLLILIWCFSERFYKVIPAKYYLEHFASDRSHMIDTKTGEYFVAPPSYQCIKTNGNFLRLLMLLYRLVVYCVNLKSRQITSMSLCQWSMKAINMV